MVSRTGLVLFLFELEALDKRELGILSSRFWLCSLLTDKRISSFFEDEIKTRFYSIGAVFSCPNSLIKVVLDYFSTASRYTPHIITPKTIQEPAMAIKDIVS
jgi:hypothetical protein